MVADMVDMVVVDSGDIGAFVGAPITYEVITNARLPPLHRVDTRHLLDTQLNVLKVKLVLNSLV